MIHALVPIKPLAEAKTRLATLLTPQQRRALALAMFEDVLAALVATPEVAAVSVIGGDALTRQQAEFYGARAVADPRALNQALTQAAAQTWARGQRPLIVFADLPLATPAELGELTAHNAVADIVLAGAPDGGTNAMLCAPTMPLLFGSGSLAHHLRAAEQRGLRAKVLDLPGLARDIDRPEDIWWLAEHGVATRAGRLAQSLIERQEETLQ
ncbi:MAG: 2-phospho-L-lactate guanylyltransferase [Roseiflexaceae bacterium]|nr:2-phospho-L-lactate guanylyltransferase [Roseiflexaceae bacterium]